MLISVNYAECSNMDFKEYNGEHKHSYHAATVDLRKERKKERKKIRMKHLLLLWRFVIRTKYDFNSKLHKPFCTKAPANACMICVSFCNKVRNNFTTVERKTSSRVT